MSKMISVMGFWRPDTIKAIEKVEYGRSIRILKFMH